jgi:SAM-dependent methyltransferase
VLDVACGGGVVACAFAPRVKHLTGIDMTPAMLARGAEYAKELGLTNLTWQQGRCHLTAVQGWRVFDCVHASQLALQPCLVVLSMLEVRPHDLDSWFSPPVTLQSNFIGGLTNGYRKSPGSMCVPISRRRAASLAFCAVVQACRVGSRCYRGCVSRIECRPKGPVVGPSRS